MELHEFTDEQIKAEYKRRQRLGNAAWYYQPVGFDPDPEWRSENPEFVIVNRRMWHLTKKVQEICIDKMLTLPKGFKEHGTSHFRFDTLRYRFDNPKHRENDPWDVAIKLLEEYQFVRLNQPIKGNYTTTQIISFVNTNGARYTVNWQCDEPQYTDAANRWITSQKEVTWDSLDDFKNEVKVFAEMRGCISYFFNEYVNSIHVAILRPEVFNSLPPNPFKRLRPGQELP